MWVGGSKRDCVLQQLAATLTHPSHSPCFQSLQLKENGDSAAPGPCTHIVGCSLLPLAGLAAAVAWAAADAALMLQASGPGAVLFVAAVAAGTAAVLRQ